MHDGHEALLRPEEARSKMYESVWQAAQDEQLRPPVGRHVGAHAQLQSSGIPTLTIPTSPGRQETAGSPIIVNGPAAAATVVDVAQQMRLWTPEQIEAFARGLVRG